MCNMCTQLATLGDEMMDPKFAMIIAEALPHLQQTLKTLTVAMVSDVSQFVSNTLIIQILQEEKCKNNQNNATALVAKQGRAPERISSSRQPQKGKTVKNCPHCTNLKCKKIGHTIEKCWAEGGGSEGQCPTKSSGTQSRLGPPSKDPTKNKSGKVDVLLCHDPDHMTRQLDHLTCI